MERANHQSHGSAAVVLLALACSLGQLGCRPTDSPASRQLGPRLYTSSDVDQLKKAQVADDLNLTFFQKLSINEVLDDGLKQDIVRHASQKNASPAARRASDVEADDAMAKKVDALLDDKQRARFRQIRIQYHGSIALTDEGIAARLGINDDQLRAIGQLLAERNAAVAESIKSHGGSVLKGVLRDMKRATATFDEKALAVLTPEQRRGFDDMQGKKLDWAALNSPAGYR